MEIFYRAQTGTRRQTSSLSVVSQSGRPYLAR